MASQIVLEREARKSREHLSADLAELKATLGTVCDRLERIEGILNGALLHLAGGPARPEPQATPTRRGSKTTGDA